MVIKSIRNYFYFNNNNHHYNYHPPTTPLPRTTTISSLRPPHAQFLGSSSTTTATATSLTRFYSNSPSVDHSPPSPPPTTSSPHGTLIITNSAKRRLRELSKMNQSQQQQQGVGKKVPYLRVIVDSGGCSGFLTRFKLDDSDIKRDDDVIVFEEDAVARVVVDAVSLSYLNGATIDFTSEIARSAFVISDIPNATSTCGCKVSFGIE